MNQAREVPADLVRSDPSTSAPLGPSLLDPGTGSGTAEPGSGQPSTGEETGRDGSDAVEVEPAGAVAVFRDRIGMARRYGQALATDGVIRGLIGPREPGRLWSRHVLNSAAVAQLIDEGATVVDIGSGAGLPGIPLAIARPDLSVTLVEPLERRGGVLPEIVDRLQLTNCRVIRGRAAEGVGAAGGADVVTSRAVAPLHRLAGWSAPLIRDHGLLLAMKGSGARDELDRDRAAVTAAGLTAAEVVELKDAAGAATYVIRARRTPAVGQNANRRPRRSRR